jgi:hypothetical protein
MANIENNVSSLYVPSIDSFRYRIELSEVDILNRNLLDHIIVQRINETTGELIEEIAIQTNSLKVQKHGYQIHFAIRRFFDNKELKDYLEVLINAKLLESDYLNGISSGNIEKLFKNLIDCEVFTCPFETFLSKGFCTDIDIKKDIELTRSDFDKGITELEAATLPNKKSAFGVNVFRSKSNLGIEWNSRSKATHQKPFLKLYHKPTEASISDANQLKKNEVPFFDTHVGMNAIKDRVRVEGTIKSMNAAKTYGITDLSMLGVISITPEKLNEILVDCLNRNLTKRTPEVNKSKKTISPSELIYYVHLDNMIRNQEHDFEHALEYTLSHFDDKQAKTRMKKTLTKVYQQHIEVQPYVKKIKRLNTFFNAIGWE